MKKLKIPYVNFFRQWSDQQSHLKKIFSDVFRRGNFINGSEVDLLEKNLIKKFGFKDCVTLNSGTDALVLGMYLIGIRPGDEIITPPNSFIASSASIIHLGAKPVFADIKENILMDPKDVEKKITKKTKAIMAVNLSGKLANIEELKNISRKYNLKLIEDAAQSIGSSFKNKYAGNWGDVGCFSAHPLKNLNAAGDAGFLVSNFKLDKAKLLRNHGLRNRNEISQFGYVSRLDTLQAAILNYRLQQLDKVIAKRRANANFFLKNLSNLDLILPLEEKGEFHTYHTFILQSNQRNALKKYLLEEGIETSIHYPIPINKQIPSKKLDFNLNTPISDAQSKKILSLPIHQYLNPKELEYIVEKIRKFHKS